MHKGHCHLQARPTQLQLRANGEENAEKQMAKYVKVPRRCGRRESHSTQQEDCAAPQLCGGQVVRRRSRIPFVRVMTPRGGVLVPKNVGQLGSAASQARSHCAHGNPLYFSDFLIIKVCNVA